MATILLIEDELVLLGLISTTLRADGHTVIESSDPLEALEITKRPGCEIDLVLTDVSMTPMSGIQLATRLIEQGADIPVLFMSGYTSIAGIITSSLGAGTLIQKPFTAPELRRAVKSFLIKSQRRMEPRSSVIPPLLRRVG